MKFGVTVNVGNYQSLRFDSNEHDTLDQCLAEIVTCLSRFQDDNDIKMMKDYLEGKVRK